jgi:dTDP-4-dehydrorhamnose reductase/beta-phosphoglucomutase-like phosphatase (HAD superfamily)
MILLCGSSGLLGKDLKKILEKNNIEYIGTFNKNEVENSIKINFLDCIELENTIKKINPKICINSIVERQVELCENNWNSIKKTNIDITNNLVKICNKLNIHLIHISTDYVFDGLNPPYYPNSQTNPLQNYGISKLISEMKILANTKNYTIIRVPVLYTDNIDNYDNCAVTLIGKKILNRIEIFKEDNYSVRRPVYIPDLCYFILDLIKNPLSGIFHFYNPYDNITKFQISNLISNYLNKKNNIIPINNIPNDGVDRPKDTQLLDNKYNILDYKFTSLENGIEKCFLKMYHPKLNINCNLNTNNIFFMIDLDGTLINSDILHYQAYKEALLSFNQTTLDLNAFNNIINNSNIDTYLKKLFNEEQIIQIKELKQTIILKYDKIEMMKNSDKFINYIYDNKINHVVVTNTNSKVVENFKQKLPILKKLSNWCTRTDYVNPKPDPECYLLGKKKYFSNEKFIIGIENTIIGYKSLKNVTDCIYLLTDINNQDYNNFKNKDAFLINDFLQIFTA